MAVYVVGSVLEEPYVTTTSECPCGPNPVPDIVTASPPVVAEASPDTLSIDGDTYLTLLLMAEETSEVCPPICTLQNSDEP